MHMTGTLLAYHVCCVVLGAAVAVLVHLKRK